MKFLIKVCLLIGSLFVCLLGVNLAYFGRALQRPAFVEMIGIQAVLFIMFSLLLRLLYLRTLARPLAQISDALQHFQGEPMALPSTLSAHQCREIQQLSQAVAAMLKQVHALAAQVKDASQNMLEASEFVFTTLKTQASLLASQMNPVHEMTTAVRELVLTSQHISEDVRAVVEVANETLRFAEQGQNAVLDVGKSMEAICHSSQISSDTIMALGKRSEHIGEVVSTIDRIIEDTKLIAFNATIEAARAKDEGKGFSVVAFEIKRLAEEVFDSTRDIQELIQEIQSASHTLILAAEEEMKTVRRGALLAEEAGTSLKRIFDMVKLTTDSAQRIASATQQQQGASAQVLQFVDKANQVTQQFSEESRKLATTAAELTMLSEGLRQILAQFEL